MTPALTPAQHAELLRPIHPNRVRQHKGQSHIEAWDVRRFLNRIFGIGGWDLEIKTLDCVSERSTPIDPGSKPVDAIKSQRHWAVYRCVAALIVKDPNGEIVARFEDGACGDSQNQPSLGDCHDMAAKTAMSQALKRCAANLGDQFGLSLYNGGSLDPVVGRTIGRGSSGTEAAPAPGPVQPEQDTDGQAEPPEGSDQWIAAWYDDLAAATDRGTLTKLWTDAAAATRQGIVTEREQAHMSDRWKQRKEALFPAAPADDEPPF